MKVIDVCSTLQELCSLDRILEKLPVWRKGHAEKNVQVIMSHPNRLQILLKKIFKALGTTNNSDNILL